MLIRARLGRALVGQLDQAVEGGDQLRQPVLQRCDPRLELVDAPGSGGRPASCATRRGGRRGLGPAVDVVLEELDPAGLALAGGPLQQSHQRAVRAGGERRQDGLDLVG